MILSGPVAQGAADRPAVAVALVALLVIVALVLRNRRA